MTTANSENHPFYEIDGGPLAHVWQIVDAEQSYRLACIALRIGARSTDGREDFLVEPFSSTFPLHARLPGASVATADDYVFSSAMPLEGLVTFMEEWQASKAFAAAA
ncbi:hypothetical protein P6U16_13500 [Rhizobium sp. 32-5/1]|uniref:hypothetical protein n=1 Tax=Rhizobium sp. 32-5/1 TaxID=3019602 RepID=UPI00240D905B|nr:hypothetical protein [Rhizobium sp. 32-5/1]WEZ82191.1 hypothetical protein P6U16_13500 [Rhizobium sp. 32-5/1]